MKKFLFIAFAALFVGSANAQFANKQTVGKARANKPQRTMALPQAAIKNVELRTATAEQTGQLVATKILKQLQVTPSVKASLKPANKVARAAAVQQMYEATGVERSTSKAVSWEMYGATGTYEDGTTVDVLQNLTPDPFEMFEDGIMVEYTLQGNNIVIEPQLMVSGTFSFGEGYVFLEDANSADGKITLTLDNNGNIIGTYSLSYNIYSSPIYDPAAALPYYYEAYSNVKYNLPGAVVAPEVSFETSNLVLFADLGVDGYAYNTNYAMTSAYAPLSFANLTVDKATEWQWSAIRESADGEETLTGNEKDFVINTVGLDVYSDIKLIGVNQTSASDPFVFGVGRTEEVGLPESYIFAGGTQYEYELSEGTYATMSRLNPAYDVTFYLNWATPDRATNSMHKIYNYFEKPATPLYIEGVTIPVLSGTFNRDFNLHMTIYEVEYTGSKPVFGRIIAESDATIANIVDNGNVGGINFTDLYVEDEIGMSEIIEFLHIDTEFMIVIEGWDNGTFSAVPAVNDPDLGLANTRTSTWFEMTGEEGTMYAYSSWKTPLLIGLTGATYGWLHTEDDTNVTIAAEGGEATIHIASAMYPAEYTWIDDETETPEWLDFSLLPGETDYDFDFVFKADALPEGVESREAEVTFVQWGAKLTVKVVQTVNGGGNGDDEPKPYIAWVYTEGYGAYSYAFATDPVVKALQEDYNVVDVNIDADTNPTSDEKLNSTLLNADVVVVCEAMTGNKTMSNSLVKYVGQVPVIALKAYNYNDGRWSWGTPANPSPAALGFTANTTYKVLDGVTYEEDGTIKVATETASNAIQTVTFGAGAPEDMVIMGTVGDGAAMYASNAQKFFGLGLSSDCWSYYTENPGIIVKNAVAMLIAGEDLTAVNETEGINTVITQGENGAVYNLQGQRVLKAQKGLYIVNGKKYIVK